MVMDLQEINQLLLCKLLSFVIAQMGHLQVYHKYSVVFDTEVAAGNVPMKVASSMDLPESRLHHFA